MATRAIKKLTKGNDLKQLSALAAKHESDEENSQSDGDETTPPIVPKNKFDLVNRMMFIFIFEEKDIFLPVFTRTSFIELYSLLPHTTLQIESFSKHTLRGYPF